MSARVAAIVQARMGSKRLPGKVLLEIEGEPMLARVVQRLSPAGRLDRIVVATSDRGDDDPIVGLCQARGYVCFRGHPTDLLDRYYRAAREHGAEIVVRITADCPLIDPGLVDQAVAAFQAADGRLDLVANRLPGERSYPIGLDTEVCSMQALERAWREAGQPHQREHVMPYLYEEQGRFRTLLLHANEALGHMRWTVDTPQDLTFVRRIYAHFAPRADFDWLEVLDLVRAKPALAAINAGVAHKTELDVDPEFGGGG